MIALALAAAVAGPPTLEPLDLRLSCRGIADDVETESGTSRHRAADGNWVTGTVTVNRPIQRELTLEVEFHGNAGHMPGPGGAQEFKTVQADPAKIVARYSVNFINKPTVEINRLTGVMTIRVAGEYQFRGTCEPAPPPPTQPKF